MMLMMLQDFLEPGSTHLGNGECLLLHDLMEDRACAVTHLIKLINAADAVVAQHQSSGLQDQLPGLGVLHHVGGETDGTGPLPRRVLASGHQVVHVLQQLGLTGAGVAAEEDVHLCAEMPPAGLSEIFATAAEELQQDALKQREDTRPSGNMAVRVVTPE